MITTVTGKNQITIPAALAARMGLHPGVRIDWSQAEPDCLLGRVLPEPAELAKELMGAGRKYLAKAAPHPLSTLEQEREDEELQRAESL